MQSLVSIIVPVYNAEKYLDRCIESLVNQTYTNIEIVLVDDESPDSCPEICDSWAQKDSRIKVIHKQNAGAGEARNTGIENALGDYICFVDSDDYINTDTLEKCLASIEKHKSEAVIFGHSYVNSQNEKRVVPILNEKLVYDGEFIKNELIPEVFNLNEGLEASIWGKLLSAKVIRNNNLRFLSEREFYSEDALFLLEYLSKSKRISLVCDNLYNYYENEKSLSREYKKDREDKLNAFLLEALKIANRENISSDVCLHIMARYHACAMVEYKMIALSSYKLTDKIRAIKQKRNNLVFKNTLKKEVLKTEKLSLRIFYSCIKLRLYLLCYLLLVLKAQK